MSAKRLNGKALRCHDGRASRTCCGLVIPGEWCPCNTGVDSGTVYVVPAEGIEAPFAMKILGKCYSFDPADARPQEAGDVTQSPSLEFETCAECCASIPLPDCCEDRPNGCYGTATVAISGSITHEHRIVCDFGEGLAVVDMSMNPLIPEGGFMPISNCRLANFVRDAEVDEAVDYTECSGDPNSTIVQRFGGYAVSFENPSFFDFAEWNQTLDFYAADVEVQLPSVYIVDGVPTIPTTLTMRRNPFGGYGGTFGTSEAVSVTVDITNPCNWSVTWEWDATRTTVGLIQEITWRSADSVTLTVSGLGHCGAGDPEAARIAAGTTRRPTASPRQLAGPTRRLKGATRLNSPLRRI